MPQALRFCTAPDGVRLAYALSGQGLPLVKAGHWMTHLERDWTSPVWRHWLDFLSTEHTVIRYDERGSGLSDREYPHLSLEAWVGDLEAVVDAAGADRFPLLGMSQGGPIAIAYAARHPERVSRLVLYGTYARGRLHRTPNPEAQEEAEALVALTRTGWARRNPAFRRLFTTLFIPGGSNEQIAWFDDLQQVSCSPEHAAHSRTVRYSLDVSALAATLAVPTLVLHAREDALVPFSEGRHLASLIPGARFVSLDSANHIVLEDEPAWTEFQSELRGFLPAYSPPAAPAWAALTSREREILDLVADGHGNQSIAAALHLSVRTVERHLSNCYTKLGLTGKGARAGAAARHAARTTQLNASPASA
ncbi:MAG TPA: alpha/beta fold hydrolase [Kineosporiaceae bacterium]|nr:alpha/beta fold hydrolase [Kineosporiaceae bacterium]